jgi:hypothetical protein
MSNTALTEVNACMRLNVWISEANEGITNAGTGGGEKAGIGQSRKEMMETAGRVGSYPGDRDCGRGRKRRRANIYQCERVYLL